MKLTTEQRNRIVYAMRAAQKSKNSDWYINMLTAGMIELASIYDNMKADIDSDDDYAELEWVDLDDTKCTLVMVVNDLDAK